MAGTMLYVTVIFAVFAQGNSAALPGVAQDAFFLRHKDDAAEHYGKILVKRSIADQPEIPDTPSPDMLKKCGGFKDATVMYNYAYTSDISTNSDINHAQAQAEAYLLAVQHRVMVRNDRYFDISQFPNAYQFAFPPKLPIICYHTYKAVNHIPTWYLGNLTAIFDRRAAIEINETQLGTKLYSRLFNDRFSSYLQYRKSLVEGVDILVELTMHNDKSNAEGLQKLTESLESRCKQQAEKQPFNIPEADLEVLQWFAPNRDRARFNGMSKLLIGDLIMHEILEQACKTVNTKALPKPFDWVPVHKALVKSDQYLNTTWFSELDEDVKSMIIRVEDNKDTTKDAGTFNPQINNHLSQKYYWFAFRTHIYPNDKFKRINGACDSDNPQIRTIKCIALKELLVVVRWKDIYGRGIQLDQESSGAYTHLANANKHETGTYQDKWAKAEKVINPINNGIDAMTASLKKLTIEKEFVKIGKNGKAVIEAGKAMLKVGDMFKKVLKAVTAIGKFAGPIASSICAVLSMFEEDGTAAILEKMDKGFNEMHGRFDKLEQELVVLREYIEAQIEHKTAFWNMYDSYKQRVTYPLDDLRMAFINAGTLVLIPLNKNKHINPATLRIIEDVCKNERTSPSHIVYRMHKELVPGNAFALGHLTVQWAKEDRFKLQTFLLSRANEIGELMAFTTKCAMYRYNKNQVAALEAELNAVMEHAMEVKNFIARLNNDQLYEWQQNVQQILRDKENILKNSYDTEAPEDIKTTLENKYNWNNFTVITFRAYMPQQQATDFNTNQGSAVRDGEIQYSFMSHFILNPDYSAVHSVQSGDYVHHTIVNWELKGETPAPASRDIKWKPDIEQKLTQTKLCSSAFKKLPELLDNGQDIKSMFIFRANVEQSSFLRYDGHESGYEYYTNVDEKREHSVHKSFAEGPSGMKKHSVYKRVGSGLGLRERSMDCLYAVDNWPKSIHTDSNLKLFYVANVGSGY